MSQLVTAIFPDVPSARHAADELAAKGFAPQHISLLTTQAHHDVLRDPATANVVDRRAGQGAVAGGVLGAVAGGIVAVASLAVPGGILVAGPIVAAFAGIGAGGAGGSLLGALIGTGIPEKEARDYDRHVREGGILLGVDVEGRDRAREAKRVLKQAGARTRPHVSAEREIRK